METIVIFKRDSRKPKLWMVAGLDSAELVSQMRAAHAASDESRVGVDVVLGKAGDMRELGIYEAFKVSPAPARHKALDPAGLAAALGFFSWGASPVSGASAYRV